VGFSPETTDGGGAEKTARPGGVPRQRRSSGGRGGHRRVLQLEERTGEVRRGPKGADDGGAAELTKGGGDNGAAVQRRRGGDSPVGRHGHEAEEREAGAMDCSSACSRGRTRRERKRGHSGGGAPFIGDTTGWGWAASGATRR
jgi:hypothetical protein